MLGRLSGLTFHAYVLLLEELDPGAKRQAHAKVATTPYSTVVIDLLVKKVLIHTHQHAGYHLDSKPNSCHVVCMYLL